MSASNTYTFGAETEAVDFVTEAFERCGIEPPDISATMLESARRSLGFMFAAWSNDGPKLWDIYQHTITLAEDDPDYDLPVSTIYIVDIFTRQVMSNGHNQDLILGAMSRSEYAAMPDKMITASRPTQFYFQRTLTPSVFFWPVLEAGGTCDIIMNLMRISQDIGKLSNTLDAPQRAADAIASDLAWRLAGKYAPDRKMDLKADRDEAYAIFNVEDRERVPTRIMPDVPSVFS